jgi:hypothetical protein
MSKGSSRRPSQVSYEEYLKNWESTFGSKVYTDISRFVDPPPRGIGWKCYEEVVIPNLMPESMRRAAQQLDEELDPTRQAVQQQMETERKRGCSQ